VLLRRLDEFDVALQQLVDELVDLDAFGLGVSGQVVAHLRFKIDRQLQYAFLAMDLAALSVRKVVLVLCRLVIALLRFQSNR